MDVDLVLSEGAPVYGAITDNWPTIEPYFNETGKSRLGTCPCRTCPNSARSMPHLGLDPLQFNRPEERLL